MKTAITSSGKRLSSSFDQRFGRSASFCIVEEATGKTEFIDNNFNDAAQGSGRKAAELMVELGVTRVISGDFGPRAKELLEKFNIQMVIMDEENLTIDKIINKLI